MGCGGGEIEDGMMEASGLSLLEKSGELPETLFKLQVYSSHQAGLVPGAAPNGEAAEAKGEGRKGHTHGQVSLLSCFPPSQPPCVPL